MIEDLTWYGVLVQYSVDDLSGKVLHLVGECRRRDTRPTVMDRCTDRGRRTLETLPSLTQNENTHYQVRRSSPDRVSSVIYNILITYFKINDG